jgi:hypothetical protein
MHPATRSKTAARDSALRLRDAGLRPTRQRVALADLLFAKGDRHLTAEELHEEAVGVGVPCSLATVYNTLHQFTEAGMLRVLSLETAKTYFDTNVSDHHHFVVEGSPPTAATWPAPRALWRATGMKDGDFDKPIVAVANSFTQFVPGHVHLKDLGQLVAREIEQAGGVAKEFNTIAVDDGIAMGHGGMLYSLPSRDLIADSVEYMVNAHCADALVCISNCDKITPGMLMAAMRLNIPTVFVSGGPMEAGKVILATRLLKLDLVDAMVSAANPTRAMPTSPPSSAPPARPAAPAPACSPPTR